MVSHRAREQAQRFRWVRRLARRSQTCGPPFLDDHGLLVFAEDAAEGVGDFANGGVGLDGGEDGGEEIFGGGGAALEFGEGGFGTSGVAFGAEGVEAGDLGAFDFGINAEGGNGARFVCDEVVYADYNLIFFLDGLLEFVSSFLDFSLDETDFNGTQHSSKRAAHAVDFGKIVLCEQFN